MRWLSRSISRIRFIRASETTTPPATGVAPPDRPGARAARDERHTLPVAGAQHGLDVLGRTGEDDELRDGPVPGQPVALVHDELLRLGDTCASPSAARSSATKEAGRLTPPSLEPSSACQLGHLPVRYAVPAPSK